MPKVVELGLLSSREFASVGAREQAAIEEGTVALAETHERDWFAANRDRLRADLDLAYGVTLGGA